MIGNPYPQFQNVQEWNDFVNEVRHSMTAMGKTVTDLYTAIASGEGGYVVPDATSSTKGIMKLYPTAGNNTDGTITQRALTVSLQELEQDIADIYATQSGMETAISNATENAVSMKVLTVTIPTSGWTDSSDLNYPYTCTISNSNITAALFPYLEFNISELQKAVTYGISPACESVAGGLVIYARTIPTQTISATLKLQQINNPA